MLKIYKYEGEYGILEVNVIKREVVNDELDRDQIWEDANKDYSQQQFIYSIILEELFDDDIDKIFPPRHGNKYWCGKPTDFGFCAFNDEIKIIVDAEGTYIYERF